MNTFVSGVEEKPVFNNIINRYTLKTNLTRAFLELADILKYHAGPFANNCVIGSKWRQVNDVDEFTKDGIKILRHLLVSEDPVSRFAARMVRFVGIAVDNRCHDGTTTAMLLFCRLAILSLRKLDCDFLSNDTYRWSLEIKAIMDCLLRFLDTLKITDEDIFNLCKSEGINTTIADVRAAIGYHMSMISSKGDDNLSSKIAHIIKSTPKKINGMFKDKPLSVETEEPYILKKQDYDISIGANIGNPNDYNYKSDTQYLSEDAVIFATGNEIVHKSFEAGFLTSFISNHPRLRNDLEPMFGVSQGWEELCEGKRHLIIMSPVLSDSNLIEAIMIFNKDHPECKISWFNIQVSGMMKSSFNKTLHAMSGKHLFPTVMNHALDCLIGFDRPGVKVEFLGSVLKLSNLYPKDGNVFHPYYEDEEAFLPYTLFRKETEEIIAFAMENVANPNLDQEDLTFLTHLYRILTVQEIYDIDIGGSSHDQYANRTVYEDAIGASLSAITEGIILGGYGHLIKLLEGPCEYLPDSYSAPYTTFPKTKEALSLLEGAFESVLSVVSDSLRKDSEELISEGLFDNLESKWDYVSVDPKLRDGDGYFISIDTLDKNKLIEFLEMKPGTPVLLQAYAGYQEQFRRFRDILPRLASTTTLSDMRVRDDDVR